MIMWEVCISMMFMTRKEHRDGLLFTILGLRDELSSAWRAGCNRKVGIHFDVIVIHGFHYMLLLLFIKASRCYC
jgi:hypothetical protein